MTSIEPRTETEALPVSSDPSALGQWARDAQHAHRVATSLAKTAFVPKSMSGKPDEITGAILTGAELGLDPISSIRSINIINGTPALSALALRGLVQSRGHEVWVESATAEKVVICGRRAGTEQVQTSSWDIDRAKRLGLTSRDNWTKQPQAMLTARATSEVCRLIAADVLLGLPYSVEELRDGEGEDKPARKRTAKRAAPVVEPPPLEPPAPFEDAEPDVEPDVEDVSVQILPAVTR